MPGPKKTPKTIGARVKAARKQLGLSQKEVAAATGIEQPTLWAIESGKTQKTGSLLALARVLKQTPEWIAEGTGQMTIHDDAHGVRATTKIKVAPIDSKLFRRRQVSIIGTVQAGVWRQRQEIAPGEREYLTMFSKRAYDDVEVVAFELGDQSADRALPPGILACVAIDDLKDDLRDGEHVIIFRDKGDQRETLCMLLEIQGDKRRGVLNTTDRNLIAYPSIDLSEAPPKGEKITLAYCVVAAGFTLPGR